jgi:predicted  nucleic acid-binding Zn-ribbon protein
MLEVDTTEEKNRAAQNKLQKVKSRLAEQNVTLTSEQDELSKDLERLDSERQAALDPLEADLLIIYDDLRQQRRGLAVAEVSDGACAACGATLTPSLNQSARTAAKIYNCPTCGRILFAN